MSLLNAVVAVTEEGGHVVNELIMPAPLFGVVTFTLMTALAIVTFSFRDVANRHAAKAEEFARENASSNGH